MTKKQQSQLSQTTAIDDEIDLMPLFKALWKSKKTIIIITTLFLCVGTIYTKRAPKYYQSSTSFFMSNETSSSSMGGLSNYAGLLGISGGSSSNINFISNILASNRMKQSIAQEFQDYYSKEIKTALKNNAIENNSKSINSFILGQLQLKNFNFKINETQLLIFKYFHKSPELSQNVLKAYLKHVIAYNHSMKISSSKNIITIIDPPSLPLAPFKPNLKVNLFISGCLGILISSVLILIQYLLNNQKNKS